MNQHLIDRLAEEWAQLDPVDPLRGLIADAIAEINKQPAPVAEPHKQQEPYGWKVDGYIDLLFGANAENEAKASAKEINSVAFPLYTSPQPAQPSQSRSDVKPLTDEQIEEVWRRVQAEDFHDCVQPLARAIEAKLREKNT